MLIYICICLIFWVLPRDRVHTNINLYTALYYYMFIHCDIPGADSKNFNRIHVICNNICLYRYSVRSFLTSTETTVPVDMVAFYAYLSYKTLAAVANHIIAFNKVATNVGNAYHSHSEKFIAPKSGLNVFIWTIRLLGNNSYYTTELHVLVLSGYILIRSV